MWVFAALSVRLHLCGYLLLSFFILTSYIMKNRKVFPSSLEAVSASVCHHLSVYLCLLWVKQIFSYLNEKSNYDRMKHSNQKKQLVDPWGSTSFGVHVYVYICFFLSTLTFTNVFYHEHDMRFLHWSNLRNTNLRTIFLRVHLILWVSILII